MELVILFGYLLPYYSKFATEFLLVLWWNWIPSQISDGFYFCRKSFRIYDRNGFCCKSSGLYDRIWFYHKSSRICNIKLFPLQILEFATELNSVSNFRICDGNNFRCKFQDLRCKFEFPLQLWRRFLRRMKSIAHEFCDRKSLFCDEFFPSQQLIFFVDEQIFFIFFIYLYLNYIFLSKLFFHSVSQIN